MSTGAAHSGPEPSRLLVSLTVMLTTVMAILDMTIVNVTLPHMMGALGARSDQVTWVLTSYIVAEAITIPLTGFLTGRFGRKRVMLVGIGGFVISSMLCGTAQSLPEIVFFRVMQGVFGAPLIPLSQSVMVTLFPPRERGKAMALWSIGIMLGPVLGPTLGGFITEHLNWRWVFFINLPVGLLNLVLVARLIKETERFQKAFDIVGALFMALGIGALQVVLDRGNEDNWFESHTIVLLSLLSVASLVTFAWRSVHRGDSVLNLQVLKDRNLALSSFMMATFGLGLFGTIALQPIMLERLFNYPAETTGLVMAPRALGSAFSMMLVAKLINRFDARKLVFLGLCLAATGTWLMSRYNLQISTGWVVWPGVVQGLGLGMIFVPLSTIAYETISKNHLDEAAGIFNLARTLGSAMGISAATTVLSHASQTGWNELGGHFNPFNPALYGWLARHGLTLDAPLTPHLLAQLLGRQSTILAFVDVFYMIAISFLVLSPLLMLMGRPQRH